MKKKETATIINLSSIKTACRECSLNELCLPVGLNGPDLNALDRLIRRSRVVSKGGYLYRVGDPLRALFAIRSGSIKTYELRLDGQAQIMGFHLPGELLGIDAINSDRHPCNAVALEHTEICEIPFDRLEELSHAVPDLQHQLLRIMSREIARDEKLLLMLGQMNAEERLAACLISFGQRHKRLGSARDEFRLSMSRQDLADYLGLALETVSRLLSRFNDEGLIAVQGRRIALRDAGRLDSLASGCGREGIAPHKIQTPADS